MGRFCRAVCNHNDRLEVGAPKRNQSIRAVQDVCPGAGEVKPFRPTISQRSKQTGRGDTLDGCLQSVMFFGGVGGYVVVASNRANRDG